MITDMSSPTEKSEEKIQMQINKVYEIIGFSKRIKVDGIIGKETKNAIKEVQRILKMMDLYKGRVDGIWGKMTQKAYEGFMHKYYNNTLKFYAAYDMESFFIRAKERFPIFLHELEDLLDKHYNGVKMDEVLKYLSSKKEEIISTYNRLSKNKDEKHKKVIMQVILASYSAECVLGVSAKLLISIAISETGIRNVFGVNGQGVMQITKNSSVSHLKGAWKEKANKVVEVLSGRKNLIADGIKYSEVPLITHNVFAAAETLIMKIIEAGVNPIKMLVRDKEYMKIVEELALRYNGHPRYMKSFAKRVSKNYSELV